MDDSLSQTGRRTNRSCCLPVRTRQPRRARFLASQGGEQPRDSPFYQEIRVRDALATLLENLIAAKLAPERGRPATAGDPEVARRRRARFARECWSAARTTCRLLRFLSEMERLAPETDRYPMDRKRREQEAAVSKGCLAFYAKGIEPVANLDSLAR